MYTIKKSIEFDAGHRVLTHGSKCRNPHGHRYNVEVECSGEILVDGEQAGMLIDFGFLKDLLMDKVHNPIDHGFIVYIKDKVMMSMFLPDWEPNLQENPHFSSLYTSDTTIGYSYYGHDNFKLYITNFIPTAENLARHFFELLVRDIGLLSFGHSKLQQVIVRETPTSFASYSSN